MKAVRFYLGTTGEWVLHGTFIYHEGRVRFLVAKTGEYMPDDLFVQTYGTGELYNTDYRTDPDGYYEYIMTRFFEFYKNFEIIEV